MSENKPTAADNPNRNQNALMIRLLAAGYILYMLFQTIKSYIAGGEEAPTVFVLLISIVVLGGGAVFILLLAFRQYRKNKEAIEERMRQQREEEALKEQQELEEADALELQDEEPVEQDIL